MPFSMYRSCACKCDSSMLTLLCFHTVGSCELWVVSFVLDLVKGELIAGSACMINDTNSLFLCFLDFLIYFIRTSLCYLNYNQKQSGCGFWRRKETTSWMQSIFNHYLCSTGGSLMLLSRWDTFLVVGIICKHPMRITLSFWSFSIELKETWAADVHNILKKEKQNLDAEIWVEEVWYFHWVFFAFISV